MYKVQIGKDLTKYFSTYGEAKTFCKSCGLSPRKIKPVH